MSCRVPTLKSWRIARGRRRLKIAGYHLPDDVDDEIDDPRAHAGNRDIDLEAIGHRQVLDYIAKVQRAFGRPVRKTFLGATHHREHGSWGCAAAQFDEPRIALVLRRLRHLSFDLPVELQGFVAKTPDLPALSHCRDEIQRAERIL